MSTSTSIMAAVFLLIIAITLWQLLFPSARKYISDEAYRREFGFPRIPLHLIKGRKVFTDIPTPLAIPYHPTQEAKWRQIGNEWFLVCDFCGGNCGQCGTSLGRGIPYSFDQIIENSGMKNGMPSLAGIARGIEDLRGRIDRI